MKFVCGAKGVYYGRMVKNMFFDVWHTVIDQFKDELFEDDLFENDLFEDKDISKASQYPHKSSLLNYT